MKASEDVMIDLETTGTSAGCCILSIGACTFDLTKTFYRTISHADCLDKDLRDSNDTLMWWNKQDPLVKKEAFSGEDSLIQVLGAFSDWMRRLESDKIFVWGNGADFDLPILSKAYEVTKMNVPWKPYNGRCYRTLKNLYFSIPMQTFEGSKHNALVDAKNQAAHARNILRIHFEE